MKKYSSAIKFLKQKFKTLATEGHGIRQKIHVLSWKDTPEAKEALRTLREAKKAGGRKTLGKRFLKPHKRPETGSERWSLWDAKRGTGHEARHCLLAMGLLKETPYLVMERTCHEDHKPSCAYILDLIHEALGDDEALKAEWTQERIVDLILMVSKQAAA
jgi:hypothetical protein